MPLVDARDATLAIHARCKLYDVTKNARAIDRDRCENRNSDSDVRDTLAVRDSSSRLREVESHRIYSVLHPS